MLGAGVCVAVAVLVGLGGFGPAAPSSPTPSHGAGPSAGPVALATIGTCSEAALAKAVSKGGTVTFGLSCSDHKFTTPIAIPFSLRVTITSAGHTVLLGGQAKTQLFVVTGGILTLKGLTLEDGKASGRTGSNGKAGGAGAPGSAGGNGLGGAIYNTTVPKSEKSVTFSSDSVTAGTGGVDNCAVHGTACPGPGGPGGGGGSGGTGGLGGLDGDGHGQGKNATNGTAGLGGATGGTGGSGSSGSNGSAKFADQP